MRPTAAPDKKPQSVTFFRPIKHGERNLRENLEIFLAAIEPGDQVLFGVSSEREREICEELAMARTDADIACPAVETRATGNPKIAKLAQLVPFAVHGLWIVLDGDARADAEFLRRFRSEWESSGADACCAPYVFARENDSFFARMDAIGTELALWPGVAWLRAFGRANFLTGACMAVRARSLRDLGGWARFSDALADDHELGRAVALAGGTTGISRCVVGLSAPDGGIADWALHQHRAYVTFRVCDPAGCLGLPLTFGLAATFGSVLARPSSPWRWLLHVLVLACRQSAANALPAGPRPLAAVWLSGLAEPVFWLLSWLPLPVRWAGKWLRPSRGMLLVNDGQSCQNRLRANAVRG